MNPICRIKGTSFQVIKENEDQVEISFTRTWDSTQEGKAVPLNIDKRFSQYLYVMLEQNVIQWREICVSVRVID